MAQFIVGKCLKSAQALPLDSMENYWFTVKAAELEEEKDACRSDWRTCKEP
ncbi:MAG: hypothetical protein IPK32_12630 [Verrucomicrobiaceae bacterium]|nr:hypothetical protein [Verrucomicrobiaceae bacterium]